MSDVLTAEQRDKIVEELARRVVDRRLESVATLFLEMNKPISVIGASAILVGAPLLGTLFGYDNVQRLGLFFQSPDNVELLLVRIEEMSRERDIRQKGELRSAPGDASSAPAGGCVERAREGSR